MYIFRTDLPIECPGSDKGENDLTCSFFPCWGVGGKLLPFTVDSPASKLAPAFPI